MGGKSTFLRQNALISILAQMGSFVPADRAELGIVDQLFCRVGASDDLGNHLSTFMVEMVETAAILKRASARSMVQQFGMFFSVCAVSPWRKPCQVLIVSVPARLSWTRLDEAPRRPTAWRSRGR